MSDDVSDIIPDEALAASPVIEKSAVDDIIPHEALKTEQTPKKSSPWMGPVHVGMDIVGGVAHAAGTLHDIGTNLGSTLAGDNPPIQYGSPDSMAAKLSAPFAHEPDTETPDVKEQIRLAAPKLSDMAIVKKAMDTPVAQTLAQDVIPPAADVAQGVGTVAGMVNLASAIPKVGPALNAPMGELLSPKETPALTGPVSANPSMEKAAVLQRVGIENARTSALSGDAKSAATDYQLSKLDEPVGQAAKAQFDAEKQALTGHAGKIVEATGGTMGTDEDTLNSRGQTIAAPFDKLRQYFDQQKQNAYDIAKERAAGKPIGNLENTGNLLKDPDFTETLLAKNQGGLLDSIKRQYERFQGLHPEGMTVENAENFRKWINQVWSPENSATLGKVKGAIDEDVFKGAGEDIYGPARKIVQTEAQTLDNPNGVSKLMDFDPKTPLNRTTAYSKIPDTLTRLDPSQFDNVIKTLDSMPEELQADAQAAKAEIKAHLANKIYDAGTGTQGQWDAPSVSKVVKANSAKLQSAFADQPEVLKQIQDLDQAGKILKVDQSYPGSAAQAANLARRGGTIGRIVGKGTALAGSAAGGTAGAMLAGPPGAVAGSVAGGAFGANIGSGIAGRSAEKAALKNWNSRVTKVSE